MKFDILNRFSGEVQITAEIVADALTSQPIKLGLAVKWALLKGANLYGANLTRANLYGANLDGANLTRANLYGANLYGANLTRANLYGANLDGANLDGANLYGANLTRANLYGANLDGANLTRANLYGAKVSALTKLPAIAILPDGDLIGWKKLKDGVIAKLAIPLKAKRVNSTGRKCRAEYVKVLALFGRDDKPFKGVGIGAHDGKTQYRVGKLTKPDKFNDDWRVECTNGIHFFITRDEAKNY